MATTAKSAFGTKLYMGDGGVGSAKASLTHGSTNGQIVFTAKNAGTGGNSITITITNGTFGVSVVGNAISIVAATATDTINNVIAAIYATPAAAALIDVTDGTGNGTGLITTKTVTNLSGGTNSAEVFSEIVNCTAFAVSGISRSEIDVTSHSSPSGAMETIAEGVYDPGSISFTMFFNPSDTVHQSLESGFLSAARSNYKLAMPVAVGIAYTFEGWVQDFSETYDPRGAITKSVTLRITGPRTQV